MLEVDVAPGIHRIEDAFTNWYLVEDDPIAPGRAEPGPSRTTERLLVVDAGVPSSWESFHDALRQLGRSPSDVEALVLTHAHFDHIGFAERARRELNVPVWVHTNDAPLARHPRRFSHERARFLYFATQVRALPIVASLLRSRAFWPPPVREVRRYEEGTLDVPGSPRVVFTPGHTLGHCALHFPERDALIVGDAFVMLDPYTAKKGPRVVARAATADSERALASLSALERTGAKVALTGHGEPWRGGVAEAVARARAAGVD